MCCTYGKIVHGNNSHHYLAVRIKWYEGLLFWKEMCFDKKSVCWLKRFISLSIMATGFNIDTTMISRLAFHCSFSLCYTHKDCKAITPLLFSHNKLRHCIWPRVSLQQNNTKCHSQCIFRRNIKAGNVSPCVSLQSMCECQFKRLKAH